MCNAEPLPTISTTTAMIRLVLMWAPSVNAAVWSAAPPGRPWPRRGIALDEPSAPKRLEPRAQVSHDRCGLLPSRIVSALGVLAVEKQLRVGTLRPTLRGRVDLVRKCAHDHRELNTSSVEEAASLRPRPGGPIQ